MLARGSPRAAALAAFALGVVALAALAWSVRGGYPVFDAFDSRLAGMRVGVVDAVLDIVDLAGSLPVWAAVVGIITLTLSRGRWRIGAEALSVVVMAEAATTAVKVVVARARPPEAEISYLIVVTGFPSGHVTRTAVLVGVMLFLLAADARRRQVVLALGLVAVVVMGMARVSAGAHYTSDVLGALLLSATVLAGWQLLSPRLVRGRAAQEPQERERAREHSDLPITAQRPR